MQLPSRETITTLRLLVLLTGGTALILMGMLGEDDPEYITFGFAVLGVEPLTRARDTVR